MNTIIQELTNPVWWLSVIVAGFCMNFLASIAFKKYEENKSQKAKRKKEAFTKYQQDKELLVQSLLDNPHGLTIYQLQANSNKIDSVRSWSVSLLLILLAIFFQNTFTGINYFLIAFFLLGTLMAGVGIKYGELATQKENIINETLSLYAKRSKEKIAQ